MIGIYMFLVNGKYAYVGQSINVEKRLDTHKKLIEKNEHPNVRLDEPIYKVEYSILAECNPSELNEYERKFYDEISTKYEMLNKRDCGTQGVNGDYITFNANATPNLTFRGRSFYIDKRKVGESPEGMYCLSDLVEYIRDNSNYDIRVNAILNKKEFIERINALCGMNILNSRDAAGQLKDAGIYKVIGARDNKKVYCSFEVFITFAFYSCPQVAASVCMMIGDNI